MNKKYLKMNAKDILGKAIPVFIIILIILQMISVFFWITPIIVIIGCLVVLNTSIHWGLKGGLFSATLCSFIFVFGHVFALLHDSEWLTISTACMFYYILGIGVGGIIGTLRSQRTKLQISEELIKTINTELVNEKDRLRITLHSIGDGVICTDNDGKITMLNDVAKRLTGWIDDTAIGRRFSDVFVIINEFTREKCEDIVEKVLECGKILELANHTILISKDGIERPIEDSAAPIVSENIDGHLIGDMKIVGVVLVFRDFSEKREKQKTIEFLSYHDQLTGLYNYRFYNDELMRLYEKRSFPLTIIMGDVNRLKSINDSFGHAMGDELLKKTADGIKKACRNGDIIARLGGDEFVMILPETDSIEAQKVIERIQVLLFNEIIGARSISVAFGYDTMTDEKEDIQQIFRNAEERMYKNKQIQHDNKVVLTSL
ncbi:MAG: GGDEF domain-containing protein [Saccharofermentanales bacterium]